MYKGELDMGVTKMTKIAKKYMNYCAKCGNDTDTKEVRIDESCMYQYVSYGF